MRLQAPRFWESKGLIARVLWPVSCLYGAIITLRVFLFSLGVLKSRSLPVPVIFVGNIRVGGTGKTPIVIALAQALYWRGFSPGIILRGYRSNLAPDQSQEVFATSTAQETGDEALLIAQQVGPLKIPVWIGAHRHSTGLGLLKKSLGCNVIISDDGLQHYSLSRDVARNGGHDIEIVVRDFRGEGNGYLLPAGPLRETATRPRDITLDLEIASSLTANTSTRIFAPNTYQVPCLMQKAYQLINPKQTQDLTFWKNQRVLAVAGIAAPEKFFTPLRDLGLNIIALPLEDHVDDSGFNFDRFDKDKIDVILMTEKDAVKCSHLRDERIWVVPLETQLPHAMMDVICEVIHRPAKRS